jgi:hypothetical protein
MGAGRQAVPQSQVPTRKLSSIGATEDQVDHKDTIPQKINKRGTKIEDEAGTGEQDSPGG